MPAPQSPSAPRADPEHEARTVAAIARAFREIPFYQRLGRTPPDPRTPLAEVLAQVPLLYKKDVRSALPKQWAPAGRDIKAELESGEVVIVETSGSTGERLRVLWDKDWWLHQEARGMRTNAKVAAALDGGSGPYHEAILTTPACGLGTCHVGDLPYEERVDDHFLFLNMRADPTFWNEGDMSRMLDELERHDTIGLESDPMYLAALARHAKKTGRTIRAKAFAQLTYAFTTRAYLRAIRQAYAGPVLQLYGASEVGVLFMEGEDGRLHHCPFTTHVELLPCKVPTPGAENVAMVVVTTLDRETMPLVRFVVGDLVQVDRGAKSRFTTVPPLVSVEGREGDAVIRPDGALVTAGAINRALQPVSAVVLYQVNQTTPEEVGVDVVADGPDGASPASPGRGPHQLEGEIAARLGPLFTGLRLSVRAVTGIPVEPSGKFRVSRRHFPIDLVNLV